MTDLTTKQAAEVLGVVQGTVQVYIRQGLLPAKTGQWGRRTIMLIDFEDLKQFANKYGIDIKDAPIQAQRPGR